MCQDFVTDAIHDPRTFAVWNAVLGYHNAKPNWRGPASTKDFIIRNGEVDNHIFFMRSGKAGVYVTVEPPVWDSEAVRRPCARDQWSRGWCGKPMGQLSSSECLKVIGIKCTKECPVQQVQSLLCFSGACNLFRGVKTQRPKGEA